MKQPRFFAVAFTTNQAPGAYPNGTRVVKLASDDGDSHKDGDLGTVIGSLLAPKLGICYFIEWDDSPGLPVLAVAAKVKRVDVH
jgi:hypothetical protein